MLSTLEAKGGGRWYGRGDRRGHMAFVATQFFHAHLTDRILDGMYRATGRLVRSLYTSAGLGHSYQDLDINLILETIIHMRQDEKMTKFDDTGVEFRNTTRK